MNTYIFINAGECNDALRDRDFTRVLAEDEQQARVILQVHLVLHAEDASNTLYADDHAVFCHSTSHISFHDDVIKHGIQSLECGNESIPKDFIQSMQYIIQYATNDELSLVMRYDADDQAWYFGTGEYGIQFTYNKKLDRITYFAVGG